MDLTDKLPPHDSSLPFERPLALDLTSEELARLVEMKQQQDEMVKDYQAAIERALVGKLEVKLGRVPSKKEIKQKGSAEIDKDGNMVFSWKGKPFMTAAPLAPLSVQRG